MGSSYIYNELILLNMRLICLLFCLQFCFLSHYAFGQDKSSMFGARASIDPRQFVSISENNRQSNVQNEIFNGNVSSVLKVDVKSELTIKFDMDSMAKCTNYYGNVSVIARINDEQIKVSPYSKVGEKQGQIGVKSASPIEISSHLFGLVRQFLNLQFVIGNIPTKKEFDDILISDANRIDYALSYFSKLNGDENVKSYDALDVEIQNAIDKIVFLRLSPLFYVYTNEKSSELKNKDILGELNRIKNQITATKASYGKLYEKTISVYFKQIRQQIDLSKDYLSFFKDDPEIIELYLRLMKQDMLSVQGMVVKLTESSKIIHLLDKTDSISFSNIQQMIEEDILLLKPLVDEFNVKMLNSLADKNIDTSKMLDLIANHVDREKILSEYERNLKNWQNVIAVEVGALIYQKLFIGSIDLREARAKEGDLLKISILWYQNNGPQSMPLELNLVSFELKEIGWRLKPYDSFFLIERISEPKDKTDISPSNFKGAPGVSLLFQYGDNGKNNNGIFRNIEPSVGLNVSYLDFYTNKDIEIGVGMVLGLLHNQIFLTCGYNLHSESNGGYLGLGFSFANLVSHFDK